MSEFRIRDLSSLDDCRRIVDLEKRIWGYTDSEDLVPAIMLFLCAKRGGMLIASEGPDGSLEGFAFSMASIVDGRPAQWSHMMGVVPGARTRGLGRALKLAQRDRALTMGIDLIEWTFDPLQAVNAHLNFARLGVVASTYAEDLYGASSSVLHRGSATDRLIVEWRIRTPHVERRLATGAIAPRDAAVSETPALNDYASREPWDLPGEPDLAPITAARERVLIRVPARFGEMQVEKHDLAAAWRLHTRGLFSHALGGGYQVVDFFKDHRGGGAYLLALR